MKNIQTKIEKKVAIAIMLIFSSALISVNPISVIASNPPNLNSVRLSWTGVQYPAGFFPDSPPPDVKYSGNNMIVKVSGMRMNTYLGYDFGSIHVAYERIDNLTIIFNTQGLPYPTYPPLERMYLYPHNGKITWYDSSDKVVGTGTFGSRGGNYGSLVVNGPGLHVEGEYGLKVDFPAPPGIPYLVGHQGWYIITL